MKTLKVIALLLMCLALGCGKSTSGPEISVAKAWSRPALAAGETEDKMGSTGVVYLTLRNNGAAADRLLLATSDVAEAVELHRSKMVDGKMSMEMLKEGVIVPAGGEVVFAPGGYHIMLIGLKRDLKPGDQFPLTLAFEKSGTQTVTVVVQNP
ncbi:MAG: copper chaperone PCu(A)C [Calditrichaeota bacterium]|nr:MAG: copper chaperone PCu(A)C [Calditrichota bacterium]